MTRLLVIFAGLFLVSAGPRAALSETLTIGGTGAALGTARLLADAYEKANPGVVIQIPESVGSGGGVKAVLKGRFDIGVSARPLKDKETAQGARAIPFARTPFVFAASSKVVPQNTLTSADIAGIYDRRITVWSDGTAARAILRPDNDSDNDYLAENFPGIESILVRARAAKGALIANTDQIAMELAEQIPGAMTTGTLAAIATERRPLAALSIDGVAPTVGNLANGSYRMAKTLRFVLGPEPSARAVDFVRFTQSDAGAAVLRAYGSLPADAAIQ